MRRNQKPAKRISNMWQMAVARETFTIIAFAKWGLDEMTKLDDFTFDSQRIDGTNC